VFDRFRQADASITRKIGGMGLGLAIVKELVDHHAGSVAAHSGGLGKGATFTVLIPVAETPTPSGLDSAEQSTDAVGEGTVFPTNIHLLVVDDEPDSREFMRRVLEDQGANVRVADSAASAFELMKTGRFDVLVSDIGMPGEDGYSLIRRVRALSDSEGGRIPAIAVTAYARVEDKAASLLAGFNHHLAKPINTPRLSSRDNE
ncbi:MAG: response regulator, partial [Proteobacteria bacterium]|nr:response regulator [Pseudomonadota bacterium]